MANPLYEKSYAFSLRVVKAYKYLVENKKEYVLSKQFLRAGTSIGANVAEANGAISKAEFSAKLSVAYKESLEVKYWLCLLKDSGYMTVKAFESLHTDVDELSKMLFASINTTRGMRAKKNN